MSNLNKCPFKVGEIVNYFGNNCTVTSISNSEKSCWINIGTRDVPWCVPVPYGFLKETKQKETKSSYEPAIQKLQETIQSMHETLNQGVFKSFSEHMEEEAKIRSLKFAMDLLKQG